MKTKSNSRSAFLIPRVVLGFALCSAGVLLALAAVNKSRAEIGCTPPPPNMVSWWPGDGIAQDIQDSNHGALQNGATFAPGMVGQAFSFDGVDDFVEVANAQSLQISAGSPSTLEAWIFPSAFPADTFIPVTATKAYYYGLLYHTRMQVFRAHVHDGEQFKYLDAPFVLQTNSWTHVAQVWDGNLLHVYVNGQLISSGEPLIGEEPRVEGPLFIGKWDLNPGRDEVFLFSGFMDEVSIYNRALSASEVQAIFNAGSAGKCKPLIFVFSIDPRYQPVGQLSRVGTSVTIQDTNNSPISKATVNVRVREPDGELIGYRLKTDDRGIASFSFVTSETGTYTFTVVGLSASGRTSDPSLNVETSDSITIP